ncbi:MAG: hypothetical protein AAGJ40_20565 [Planctomycetota bacterium]
MIYLTLLGGMTVLSACDSGPELAIVRGTVSDKGVPLDAVKISFIPDVSQGSDGSSSSAYTDDLGNFELAYGRLADRPGAVVGWHRVAILDAKSENYRGNDGPPPPLRIPRAIRGAGSTPIEIEVVAGEQSIDIDIADYQSPR